MSILLRPYQQQLIDAIRSEFNKKIKRVVAVAPCGSGKTVMTGWMIREALKKGNRSIFFVHRKELIEQTAKMFNALEIPFGVISAGFDMNLNLPVQIASVQTLARRVKWLKDYFAANFLICDECHHILANTYKKILDAFPGSYLLGVTATPERMGGITLVDAFDALVQSLDVDDLIALGNLSPFKYFAPAQCQDLQNRLNQVKVRFGEFVNADLERVMSSNKIIGGIVDNYRNFADGKSAICYCVNVRHSSNVAQAFRDAGIPAAHCDGETPPALRAAIVNDFRNGKINVLCNAELFGEGFDVPACQAVILARPTCSLTLFIQQAMRPLRIDPNDPNKVAVIIDHVQNYLRHGLPNAHHDWSLAPNPPAREKALVKACKHCHLVLPANAKVCPACGYQFKGEYHAPDTHEYHGQIAEIALPSANKKTVDTPTVKRPFTKPEEFLAVAKKRGYKIYWVACQALKFAESKEDCLHIAKVCGYKPGWAHHAWEEKISPPETRNALPRTSPINSIVT